MRSPGHLAALSFLLAVVLHSAFTAAAAGQDCGLSAVATKTARAQLCRGLAMQNTTRIFLYGDSLIGQMGLSLAMRDARHTTLTTWSDLNATACKRFQYLRTARPFVGCRHQVDLVHLGQFTDPSCVAAELYEGSANLRPEKNDVLVILQGAHHRMHTEAHIEFYADFVRAIPSVAAKFPGRVVWVEPFVQHFRRGIWIDDAGSIGGPGINGPALADSIQNALLDNTGGPEPQACWRLDGVDDSMQLLRASLVRETAASLPNTQLVPV